MKFQPGSAWSRHAVALGAMIFSALHIHQMQGLIEIHFGIFAYLAVLVFYRDWRVIVTAVVTVLVYHVAFFVMQLNSVPVFLFEAGHLQFNFLLLHAFYALLEGSILVYICRRMYLMGLAGAELEQNIQQKMYNEDTVKLGIKANTYGSIKVLEQYNHLFIHIDELAKQAKQSATKLDSQADGLKNSCAEISKLKVLSRQHTDSIAASTEQMSLAIAEVAKRANQANERTTQALLLVEQTDLAITQSKQEITTFEQTINHTSLQISALSESCKEVSTVVEAIQAIADQTNLLALNAAIESARAGEHGRGFAVVADEVRQLSFRTKESTAKITDILKALLQKSENSVAAMQSSINQLEKMLHSSETMQGYINETSMSVKVVSENIDLVAIATEQQASTAHSIAQHANDVKKITEDEIEFLNKISASSVQVYKLSEQLRHALLRFE
ncbi:methyl-accepting chemotaxis protein [Catenovulum sp. 2E275]|uniref:methyl-accepting chemotaxis protein n=1 Tax=Catenovulum sp. 2E275 TaxID=2980497 RepID=UPI0021CF7FE1|nr:methyl-accepting chemotaxis protein [Catenovulum sp. 2E275]MCU4677607.1 methyl-accepting chemotaxis protein [Catenovulum sp. 2E275]